MRKISIVLTVLITSFVMALAGLVASPIASAGENGNGSISATFPLGSSVLTKDQKAAIKKALASSGTDVSFTVTGTAGKLPGVSDRWVQRLAKKRAQAIKAYLVSLGVSNTSITTQSSTTEIGVRPKSTGSYPTPAPTPTPTAAEPAAAPAAPAAPSYAVGTTGPGGGKVFYVNTLGFACGPTLAATCNYLEAAPTSGTSAWTDVAVAWSGNTSTAVGTTATRTAIGTGYANTLAIVGQTSGGSTPSMAGTTARAYSGPNGLLDWYLPSKDELNQMCKWARAQAWTSDVTICTSTGTTLNLGTGAGLGAALFEGTGALYFSSSERDHWSLGANEATAQNFSMGTNSFNTKSVAQYIRPIRAF